MEVSIIRNNNVIYDYKTVEITDEILNDLVKTGSTIKRRDLEKAMQILFAVMLLSSVLPILAAGPLSPAVSVVNKITNFFI